MTMQDFRGQGPPGDIGSFQLPCSVIVYQHTFSGTTYIVAARSGDRGWVLVNYGTVAVTVINSAIAVRGKAAVASGIYTLTASVTDQGLNDGLLEGFGRSTIFRVANATTINAIDITSVNGWIIRDLAVDGNEANNPDAANPALQSGIRLYDCLDCEVASCFTYSCRYHGIYTSQGSRHDIHDNHVTLCHAHAVEIASDRSTISANVIYASFGAGLLFHAYGYNTAYGNVLHQNGYHGIEVDSASVFNTIIGNELVNNSGIGIIITSGTDNLITGNTLRLDSGWDGEIYVGVGNHRTVIVGNTISEHQHAHGVYITTSDDCIISDNMIRNNADQGINIQSSDRTLITDNRIISNTNFGIRILYGDSVENRVIGNHFTGNGAGCISDGGTNTILPTVRACFVKELGTAAWIVAAASAMGIDIDAADEGALAKIKLPLDLQQVVRIKVWGTAQVAEAHHMMLLVVAGAGGDNESWTAEAIAPAAKASDTVNFANLDNIQWTFTATEDSDIGDLAAGDFLQWCCYYNAVSGADCATDLLLAGEGLEIQYV